MAIKRISHKRLQQEFGGKIPFSTLRRTSCNATTAEKKSNAAMSSSLDSISASRNSLTISAPHVRKTLALHFGKPRKPVKKQSEIQKARLQKLANIRRVWWMDAQVSHKPLVCGICDEEIRYFEDLASDHIEPGSAKSDSETNLHPAHQLCNVIKGSQRNFKILPGTHDWKLIHGLL